MTDEGVREVHDPAGDTALNHQAAGQDKQRNGNQSDAVRAGEEALNHYGQGVRPLYNTVERDKSQGKADGDSNEKQGEQKYDVNHAWPSFLNRSSTCAATICTI